MFDPEHESIEGFVEYLLDEDRSEFTHEDLQQLAHALKRSTQGIRKELESWGLKLTLRQHEQHVRGINTSSNDRFWGPGSSKMHGGSGWEQVLGFAGQKG